MENPGSYLNNQDVDLKQHQVPQLFIYSALHLSLYCLVGVFKGFVVLVGTDAVVNDLLEQSATYCQSHVREIPL